IRAALDIVQSLGADAFGCNCSTGPDQMIPLLHSIAPYAHIPLIAKPNAGLPTLKDGNTVFTMDAKTFASFSGEIQQAGIAICGGCCGTTPDHIRALAAELEGKSPEAVDSIPVFSVSTPQDTYSYGPNQDVLYLDPSSDECPLVPLTSGTLLETVRQLSVSGKKVPLVTECDIIRAVREYPGTVTLSAAGTTALSESINRTKPYGARYIIRLSSAKEFCSFISAPVYRDNPKRFLLLLPPDILETFHAEAEAPSVPWGVYLTEADARNEWLAAYRLGALLDRGAACVMIDVSSLVIKNMIVAYNALLGRDDKLKICMKHFSSAENTGGAAVASGSQHPPVFTAVLNGDDESIEKLIREELDKGTPAKEIVDTQLIPAINEVGVRYEKKEYFLPQLIMSADTMSRGFEVLEPVLLDESGMSKKDGTIVIATVKGDIHDIGKNIVALMLKNYNFDVVDLGKDVDEKHILEGALKHKADIVALSALMTTTMTEMKCAIDYAKSNGLDSKFIVGGAVVDQNYADEIGADGYSADAMGAVKLARSLVGAGEDQAVQSAE
ncbi:MAG: cobalamin-dependent protein, partial [Spirochaetota bacterium]